MSDERVRTLVTLAESGEEVAFQDYFVRLRHAVPVSGVRFEHADAQLASDARRAIETADLIVIAPSNPLVSIAPIRALPGVDELLRERRDRVVAVSPIVGGAAIKGPADRMLVELGYDASVVGVAELYAPVAATLVIDPVDAELAARVQATGLTCVVHPSVMSTPTRAAALARACLAAVGT
jgi:LPPG:FO 2-phospho-L-lactate transferase